MQFYADQRSEAQEGSEDQDPEHSVKKDAKCLLLLVINLLWQGWPHAFFFHSIHTLH